MPASRQARRTRTAISPRLATSSFLSFIPGMILLIAEGLHRRLDERRVDDVLERHGGLDEAVALPPRHLARDVLHPETTAAVLVGQPRSEEHTSELQSPCNLVCRLLLEKKKKIHIYIFFLKKNKINKY